MTTTKENAVERFWADQVEKTDGCWLFHGPKSFKVFLGGRTYKKASVLCWELEHGKIPPRSVLRRTCDSPLCVRPDHYVVDPKRAPGPKKKPRPPSLVRTADPAEDARASAPTPSVAPAPRTNRIAALLTLVVRRTSALETAVDGLATASRSVVEAVTDVGDRLAAIEQQLVALQTRPRPPPPPPPFRPPPIVPSPPPPPASEPELPLPQLLMQLFVEAFPHGHDAVGDHEDEAMLMGVFDDLLIACEGDGGATTRAFAERLESYRRVAPALPSPRHFAQNEWVSQSARGPLTLECP